MHKKVINSSPMQHKSTSFQSAIKVFLRYAVIVGAMVSFLLLASIFLLALLPEKANGNNQAAWAIRDLAITRDFLKDYIEPLGAPIALIFGVAVSISGALAAIYLASIASDVQRQQYELELRTSLDKDFSDAKRAFTDVRLAMSRVMDFTIKRDIVIHRTIRRNLRIGDMMGSSHTSFPTIEHLESAVAEANLDIEQLGVLANLSDALLAIEHSTLASSIRRSAFESRKPEFLQVVGNAIHQVSERVWSKYSRLNQVHGDEVLTYSGALQPHEYITDKLEQTLADTASPDYQPLFSEAKATSSPEEIVRQFLVAYKVTPSSDGSVQFSVRDFGQRDIAVGCSSLLGVATFDALKILGAGPTYDKQRTFHSEHYRVAVLTGSIEFASLILSWPGRSHQAGLIKSVCENHMRALMPPSLSQNGSLRNYLDQEISQLMAVCREFLDVEAIIEHFSLNMVTECTSNTMGKTTYLGRHADLIPDNREESR